MKLARHAVAGYKDAQDGVTFARKPPYISKEAWEAYRAGVEIWNEETGESM